MQTQSGRPVLVPGLNGGWGAASVSGRTAGSAAAVGVRAGADEGKRDCGSPDKELIVKITIRTRGLCVNNQIAINSRDPNQGVFCK